MKHKNHSGFTLVELIIVIAVIGVLAAILIPVFSNVISKANEKSALSDAKNTLTSYLIEATDDRSLPDNEVLIFVHKAGRYYVYGYQSNTFMSSGNNDDRGFDMSFSDLQSNYNYDASRDDLNTALTQYNSGNTSVFGNKLFWMYPTNRSVPRGIRNIDLPGYNNLGSHIPDISDNVDVYQGILLPGAEAVLNGGNSGSSETPITYTVTFNATGIEDSADLANVVYTYKGEAITGSSVEVAKDDPVGYLSATYNYNAATDSYRYRVTSMTPSSGLVTASMTVTVNFEKINIRTLSFVMGSGETFVPANESVEATMHISAGDDITTAVRSSSATTTTPNRVFSHWEKQGDSSVQYFPGSESVTMPDSNLTLVPVFTKVNITLKYYTDGEHLTGDYYQETEPYNSTTYRLPYFTTAFAAKGWTLDTGYTFNGWYDGHNTYSENALYTTFEGDEMTFTAVIIPLSFTVRYGTGTGFTAPSGTTNCIVGVDTSFAISGVTVDSAYYLTGYAVSGFASAVEPLAANATALDLTAAQAGNEIVITPQVAAKTVNVTFVSDPTSVATLPANVTGYEIKDGDITLTAPTGVAAHYSFTSYTASGTNITASITNGNTKLHLENPTANTSSVTVTAHFEADPTYSVTYNANAGTDTVTGMPSNQTGLYPGSHDLSSAAPEREGYTFQGWGATNDAPTYITSVTITNSNVTVYAIWEAESGGLDTENYWYVQLHELNGTITWGNWEKTFFSSITEEQINSHKVEGHPDMIRFPKDEDWTIGTNSTNNPSPAYGISVMLNGDYSQWFDVWYTFEANAGLTGDYRCLLATANNAEITTTTLFASTSFYQNTTYMGSDGIIHLYTNCQKTENFTVTFDMNGGTGTAPTLAQATYNRGDIITIPYTVPTKGSSIFLGWTPNNQQGPTYYAATQCRAGASSSFDPHTTYTVPDNQIGDITLYAMWYSCTTSTISFNANGATGGTAPSPVLLQRDNSITYTLSADFLAKFNPGNLTKSGKTFLGWSTNPSATAPDTQCTATTTLYAVWG